MQEKSTAQSPAGLTLGDIYYVLFRRKWIIIPLAALGVIAAVAFHFLTPVVYSSEAKVLIRYLYEKQNLNPVPNDSSIKSVDSDGSGIIISELEILRSLDLAEQVAEAIGPEKILGKDGRGDKNGAAAAIRQGLTFDVPKGSSVIGIIFKHRDRTIVQPVLAQIINSYFQKHAEIHRSIGIFDDFLNKETDQLRNLVSQTEQKLREAKAKAGIISLEDTKKSYVEQISRIRQDLYDAEAELAERQAAVKELGKLAPVKPDAPAPDAGAEVSVLPETVTEYNNLVARLDGLRKREQDLLGQFTAQSGLVKELRVQIAAAEADRKKLEEENPKLLIVGVAAPKGVDRSIDLFTENTRIIALDAKIKALNTRLEKIRAEAAGMDETEVAITDLQRKKELEEKRYLYYSSSLEQTRIDQSLGAGQTANISKIQAPSPPFRAAEKKQRMTFLMLLGGGLFGGIALAFVLELYLDRSVRRPIEVEAKLHLPLVLSMPDVTRNGYARKLKHSHRKLLPAPSSPETASPPASNGNGDSGISKKKEGLKPWDAGHILRPFFEGLRDRLITSFEVRKLTHKPKLVALTACAEGAGVSTIAAGLAACLSETGDGNVLLVDMNLQEGAAHQFFHGAPVCGLEDLLENGKKEDALVQGNLYVVTEGANSEKLPRVLPKRFTNLVPKLKASDYDYIIFDMPPISQISVTPRLAAFMDMMLMVVESEKTDAESVRRAADMLRESKTHVGVVLNKTRNYVPRRLHQEFLSNAS